MHTVSYYDMQNVNGDASDVGIEMVGISIALCPILVGSDLNTAQCYYPYRWRWGFGNCNPSSTKTNTPTAQVSFFIGPTTDAVDNYQPQTESCPTPSTGGTSQNQPDTSQMVRQDLTSRYSISTIIGLSAQANSEAQCYAGYI